MDAGKKSRAPSASGHHVPEVGEPVLMVLETGVGQRHYRQTTVKGTTGNRNRFSLSHPLRVGEQEFQEMRWLQGKWRPVGVPAKEMRYYNFYFGEEALAKRKRIDQEDNHPW